MLSQLIRKNLICFLSNHFCAMGAYFIFEEIIGRSISEGTVEPFNRSEGGAKSVFEQNNYNFFIRIIL